MRAEPVPQGGGGPAGAAGWRPPRRRPRAAGEPDSESAREEAAQTLFEVPASSKPIFKFAAPPAATGPPGVPVLGPRADMRGCHAGDRRSAATAAAAQAGSPA